MNPIDFLSIILGYIIEPCYALTQNWWIAILLFTLITKIILLPVSLWCQKNSIKMVQLTPEINRIKVKYFGDKDTINEQQVALYKKEHYHPLLSIIPLAIQLIILIGLIGVIYNITTANPELVIGILPYEEGGLTLLIPIIAGLSALILGLAQNRINPLQKEQSRGGQISTNGLSIAISLVLGIFVPMGVGFYWICSNLSSILVQAICNIIINPKKYVDYDALTETKKELSELQNFGGSKKWYQKDENSKREKEDYKKFFSIANKHLVFYSEGSGFYKYYRSVIENLLSHSNVIIHYVTNDPNDQIFEISKHQSRIKPYYIGLKKIIPLMMKMDADMVVMTTPNLDDYFIKRSYVRKDIEYVYLFHSVGSTHMIVAEGACDNYDTIFCVGPHQLEEIRAAENVYCLKPKKLVQCGYGLMDDLIESYDNLPKINNDFKTILIAPSWQQDNLLDLCIDKILEQIIDKNYKIIIRPHPEYVKRYSAKLDALINRYNDKIGEMFIIEKDFSSNVTIYTADLVITDWSTIAYEFSYSTKKPSLFINTPMKVMNPNYKKIGIEPLDIILRNQIGASIDTDKLSSVYDTIESLFKNQELYSKRIDELLHKYIYNIGISGKVGADYIINTLKERKQKHNK